MLDVTVDILSNSFPDGPKSVRDLAKKKGKVKVTDEFNEILHTASTVMSMYNTYLKDNKAPVVKTVKKKQKQKRLPPPPPPSANHIPCIPQIPKPRVEILPEPIPEPLPVEIIGEEIMVSLALDPIYRKHPIAKHPYAIDNALIAIAVATKGQTSVEVEIAYEHMLELLHLEQYIDSPVSYYQDTRKLLQALRAATIKAGMTEANKEVITITDTGIERIKALNGKAKIVPTNGKVEIALTNGKAEIVPTSLPKSPKKNKELEEYDRILLSYDEDLQLQQDAIKGINLSFESARKKLEIAQREVDALIRRRNDCEKKIAGIESDAEQLLLEREELLLKNGDSEKK